MNGVIKTGSGKYRCSSCRQMKFLHKRPAYLQNWVCSDCRKYSVGALWTDTKDWLDYLVENSDANTPAEAIYYLLDGIAEDEDLRDFVARQTVEGYPRERDTDGVSRRPKGWGCPECHRSKADYVVGVEVPDECPSCGNDDLETWDSEPPGEDREITPMDRRWR